MAERNRAGLRPSSSPTGPSSTPTGVATADASARLRRLADLGDDVMFTVELTASGPRLDWISSGATTLLGLRPAVMRTLGHELRRHVHADDRRHVLDALTGVSERRVTFRWNAGGAADPWRWFHLDVVPVDGSPGWVDGRIQSAESVIEAQQHVASAVAHETATFARLLEVEELRDHILQSLSHRVRTPLAILQACSQTALDPPAPLTDEQRTDLFERIGRATESLSALLVDLLDLPAANIVDVTDEVQLLGVLQASVNRARLQQATIDAPADLVLHGGSAALERCLVHLLDNVARHTPKGTSATISARNAEGRLVICVDDDGPGIPDHVRRRLFEPFIIGEHGPNPGLGLGLTVVKHLMGQLGGMVDVDTSDEGTRVTLDLPQVVA